MSERVLEFTMGPVQGFVSQARRTRDYWAGSFLLSYLVGQAMSVVLDAGGRMVVPSVGGHNGPVTDELLSAIRSHSRGQVVGTGPFIGTLPNRFRALVPNSFDPADCVMALRNGWKVICSHVWRDYVEPVAVLGNDTKAIWDRQTGGFWDVAWVVGDDLDLMDRRKNWRSHVPTVEPGDKCSVMGTLQELSGHRRGRDQDVFWTALGKGMPGHDLRLDERLCAIVLVKRLFPYVAKPAIGWRVPHECPSTPYVAAVHWVDKAVRTAPAQAGEYADQVEAVLGRGSSENPGAFACLAQSIKEYPDAAAFAGLNGNCFFRTALENPRLWEPDSGKERRALVKALDAISRRCGSPSPFYSLLVMDGDEMGVLLRKHDPASVSKALGAFARAVPDVVATHNGVTVYAGGDDVLALLPLEDALAAGVALRREYISCFKSEGIPAGRATLSGAIVYAHYTMPLKTVIQEGHHLLDDVAKDTTGRDSLAIAVWNQGGEVVMWSAPWETFITEEGTLLDEVVKALDDGEEEAGGHFNSTFFYNLRDRFSVLAHKGEQLLSDGETIALLAAEYMRNRNSKRECTMQEARDRMRGLLHLCRRYRRVSGKVQEVEGPLDFSALLLVRFLARKGVF